MRYITFKELQAKFSGRSRSAIYGDIAAGRLPQPFKMGSINYWDEAEVDARLAEQREAGQ